ncbi:phage head closure protein [Pseudomonas sp.]|uniref:phage head closure protein n=1 Tax=Pseudomonas sp. TaxID=306 RepID=UPI00258D1114|nr:phage head closure protein [Pseudomonas sp.]
MMIGKLRHPIDIEKRSYRQDPVTGEMLETWASLAREWARAEGISGKEFVAAGAQQSTTTVRVTLRYRADLTTSMRFRHVGKIYNIKAILPDNERKLLVCMCEEGLA